MDRVAFRYTLGQADWAEGFVVWRRVNASRFLLRYAYLTGVVAVCWVLVTAWDGFTPGELLLGAAAAIAIFAGWFVAAGRAAEEWHRVSAHAGELTVTVTEDGIDWRGDHLEVRRAWPGMGGYAETARAFVLFTPEPARYLLLILPKRGLADSGTGPEHVRELLAAHLPELWR
ncbi:YcxB family protein [Streptomyces sp. NPDC051940]|uniref:YcxB family protein n=1 Tax=Streptomyces sp. NPDC051940 TaxID=3155675 RepID=UPI00341E7653